MEEKDFKDKIGVYDVVPRSDATETGCCVFRTRWVTVVKGSDDAPQLRARWVAEEFRGISGDKHEYFSETIDMALVKAVIAPAARQAESEDIVVAVFDVRRAHFHAEEKRDIFVDLPDSVLSGFPTTHVGKLRNALYGTPQLQRRGEMSCGKDSSVQLHCWHCVALLFP